MTLKINTMTAAHNNSPEAKQLAESLGISNEVITAAAGSGIDLATLLKWVAMYGLPIITWLAQIFGWKLPPLPPFPVPPLPTPPGPI